MAVAVRSFTSTTYASRTNTTLTAPSGLADNDILLAAVFVGVSGTAPSVAAPSGFTALPGSPTSVTDAYGFNGKLNVFWKRAASESGSYTFSHSSASSQGLLLAISGAVTSGSPIDASSNNTGVGKTSTATGVTTTVPNDLLLYIAHDWEGLGALSPPSGFTEIFDSLIYSARMSQATAGASGSKTQTNGNLYGEPWAAWLIAIKPPSADVSVNITGASVSALAGTVTTKVDDSVSITGASASALAGTTVPKVSSLVTGAAATASAGGVTIQVSDSVSLTGAAATASAGAVATQVDDSSAISGASASALAGTAAAQTSDSVLLTGASCSASAGAVAPSIWDQVAGAAAQALAGGGSVALLAQPSGAVVQGLAGQVSTTGGTGSTVNISGASVAALAGAAGSSEQVSLAGAAAAGLAGDLGEAVGTSPAGAACAALAGGLQATVTAIVTGAMAAALAGVVAAGVLSPPTGASAAALAGVVGIASSSSIGISGAEVLAIAGDVSTRIIVTQLNPNYIAAGLGRQMVAVAPPVRPIAVGMQRSRVVVGISNAMSQTNTLQPPIDDAVEVETVTFDYGLMLASGVTLTGDPTVTCVTYEGADPGAASRLIGQAVFIPSPNSGANQTAVAQLVGQMVAGVTYRLQCVCPTTDGQNLSLWTHLSCQAPN